ncbi:Cation-independent mannose-6-phosphate receptor CI-MPR [Coccidioides posadasii str. Silveira]|uniref:Vacuolar sorting receptor n=1 Tax=Coccidioides posadasii (strain RMSCC 757 / Silveira) TaxID=443226 RepID=E9CZV5_COCPS|nr:vacuolar sorting receptor [Coccidioides posadasii str. Silveira]QVM08678.1 Cation-independent mannose-6-phosphate receptor CI-MPR [Coccidioides posadasii str. Silveira]
MHMNKVGTLASLLQFALLYPSLSLATDDTPEAKLKPCTIYSPNTGAYFDLKTISLLPPEMKDGKKIRPDDRETSWHSRGYDYGANFTINVCGPVIENLEDVVGVDKERWQNVSAFYNMDGKTYSIGQQSSDLVFRGRKLVLNYTDGSPCPTSGETRRKRDLVPRDDRDHDQDDGKNDNKGGDKDEDRDSDTKYRRRKSTLMSFLCDRDLVTPAATVSYVGTLDSCSYYFEVRTAAACGGVAASTDGGLSPAGVFGVIVGIAVAVYLIGGCAYQRTVMHQRGWRQCPNYAMWSGMVDFLKDMVIIGFASVLNCFKSRGGYARLSLGQSNGDSPRRGLVGAIGGRGPRNWNVGRGGRPNVDEENRLIDQLDEEWDD